MPEEEREKIIVTLGPLEPQEGGAGGRLRRLFTRLAGPGGAGQLQVTGAGSWKKSIPLSRRMAAGILTRDLPPETVVRVVLNGGGKGTIEMSAEGLFRATDSAGELGRPFNLTTGIVEKGRLMVQPGSQGGGLGRLVVRNQIEFFRACGVSRFRIHAGFSTGGYAWARFGFVPDNLHDAAFETHTKKPVQQRYAVFRPYLDARDSAVLDAAVNFKSASDLWRIADCDREIGPGLQRIFSEMAEAKAGRGSFGPEASRVQALFSAAWGPEVLNHIQDAIKAGGKVAAGQLLLAGTSWQGHLDLDDAAQMRRAGAYAGGWKYLGFEAAAGPAPRR